MMRKILLSLLFTSTVLAFAQTTRTVLTTKGELTIINDIKYPANAVADTNSTAYFVIKRYSLGDDGTENTGFSSLVWDAIISQGQYIRTGGTGNPFYTNNTANFARMSINNNIWQITHRINNIVEKKIVDVLFIKKNISAADPLPTFPNIVTQ